MYKPEAFTETTPGVFEQNIKSNAQTEVIGEHYANNALAILHSDKRHYDGFKLFVNEHMPELIHKYKNVTAIGGGSPKLEVSVLNAENITVVDGFADTYQNTDADFRHIYGADKVNIEYVNKNLGKPYKIEVENGCISFVHFLEHCANYKTVEKWLSLQENDIVIYGPNIEVAQSPDWFHFRPLDHNVFFTIEAISEIGRKNGYMVKSRSYSDDMLVWMYKEDKEAEVKEMYETMMQLQ